MNKFIFLGVIFVLASCQSSTTRGNSDVEKHEKTKTHEQIIEEQLSLNSTNDTTFLDFVLGSPSIESEKKIATLLKEGKLKGKETMELTTTDYDGHKIKVMDIKGYPYKLQLNELLSCESIVSFEYFEKKLYTLTMYIHGDCHSVSDVEDFLSKIYGKQSFLDKEHNIRYWAIGNKEVSLSVFFSLIVIEFKDLRLEKKLDEIQHKVDSLKKVMKGKKAKETKSDFK